MSLMDLLMEGADRPEDRLSMLSRLGGLGSADMGLSDAPVAQNGPRGWIEEALGYIPKAKPGWEKPLYDLMMRESGGDPRAYNDTAVASGEHAQGLFQTIPSTFEAHNIPRLGGINDPVANAVAAIRYIMGRYGSPYNLPESGGY